MKIAFRRAAGCFTLCFFSVLFFSSFRSADTLSADLLLLNAQVLTMNDQQPSAETIAIQGDRIMCVGGATVLPASPTPTPI